MGKSQSNFQNRTIFRVPLIAGNKNIYATSQNNIKTLKQNTMIKIERQTVTLESGTNRNGAIAVKASYNILSLRDLINEVPIGETWKDSDSKDLPKILIEFHTPESVDAFIRCLEVIKRNLQNPYGLYPSAC